MFSQFNKQRGTNNQLLTFTRERRRFCGWCSTVFFSTFFSTQGRAEAEKGALFGEARIAAARLWPADEYTRIALETTSALQYTVLLVPNPDRLVLDLQGLALSNELKELTKRVLARDPYIQGIRIGVNRPGVIRLVIDLKQQVIPQIFNLPPVAGYSHRLVLDLYPSRPKDPLLALLEKEPTEGVSPGNAPATTSSTPNELTAKEAPPLAPEAPQPRTEIASIEPRKIESAKANPPIAHRPTKQITDRLITIAIDPGHGGEDPGAIGQRGTYEKEVTLAVARKLKKQIDSQPNMRAMLTRNEDYFVSLPDRVRKARAVHADLFISIHADAFIKANARGSSVFVLSEHGASSAAAKWLAQRENSADLIGGLNLKRSDPMVAKILLDLSQTASRSDSVKLAKAVLSKIGEINTLHKAHVEHAGFAVLKAPDIPSILVETAFISNPDEEKRLCDQAYQEKMAISILNGVQRYFAKNPPLSRNQLAQLD